jgi:DNA-binding MarR family transcriptional regulator
VNPKHKRAKLLKLNAKGLKTLRTIEKAQRVWANGLGKEIGKNNLVRTNEVLEHLCEILETKTVL